MLSLLASLLMIILFGFYIQEPVYISRMIICISNKHACFPSIVQLGSHLFPFMYGNHSHFSNRSQMLHLLCILIVEQSVWWFCAVWSHHYIIQICFAVEMTSHQNSPFSLELMPACINIALALPTSVGIFLSTIELCCVYQVL